MIVLNVKLLGGVRIFYRDTEYCVTRRRRSKTLELLSMLWLSEGAGIDRDDLVGNLFAREELVNPANSLNNAIYQMRRQMVAAGLPEARYITHKARIYLSDPAVEVHTDVEELHRILARLEMLRPGLLCTSVGIPALPLEEKERLQCLPAEEKEAEYDALLARAVQIYEAPLLPDLRSNEWITQRAESLHLNWRVLCAALGLQLQERGDPAGAAALYRRAACIDPEGDWENLSQALVPVPDAQVPSVWFLSDQELLQVQPPKRRRGRPRKNLPIITHDTEDERAAYNETLPDMLTGPEDFGSFLGRRDMAMSCSKIGFIDTCKVILGNYGIIWKTGNLVLLTLVADPGQTRPGQNPVWNDAAMVKLLGANLRQGDFYVKWNAQQYCAVLLDYEEEDFRRVLDDLQRAVLQDLEENAQIRISFVPLAQLLPGAQVHHPTQETGRQ